MSPEETNKALVSQTNKYLDVALFWFILYKFFNENIFFMAGIFVGLGAFVALVIGYFYNKSLYDECKCEKCKKESYDLYLFHKANLHKEMK